MTFPFPHPQTNAAEIALEEFDSADDAFTVLLLHFNGADAAVSPFVDSSRQDHTVTAFSTAEHDTAQSKFGGSALHPASTTGGVEIPASADWNFGTGDFTIDFWVRFDGTSMAVRHWCFDQAYGALATLLITPNSGGTSVIELFGPATHVIYDNTKAPFAASTWYHMAIVRSGNVWKVFRDGVLYAGPVTDSRSWGGASNTLNVGRGQQDAVQGWIDEFRVSKGIARWTGNFEIPDVPYEDAELGPDDIIFVASATSGFADSIVVPPETQAGDILVLWSQAWGSSADPADATPSGWGKASTIPGANFFMRNSLFYRVASAWMAGQTISTLAGQGTEVGEGFNILGVFRCVAPRYVVTANGAAVNAGGATDPAAQIVTPTDAVTRHPRLVIGAYSASNAIDPRTFSPIEHGELKSDPSMMFKFKRYHGGEAQGVHTIDMDDEGDENILTSCWFEGSDERVLAKTGSFNTGTAAATTQIQITGLGFRPRAIFFFHTGRDETTDAAGAGNVCVGMGFVAGTAARHAVGARRNDGGGAGATCAYWHNAGCVTQPLNASASLDGVIDIHSIEQDGFTLIVDDNFSIDRRIHYLAIGGGQLSANTVQFSPAATPQTVTTLGLMPDALLVAAITATTTNPPAGSLAEALPMFGAAASPSQQWSSRAALSAVVPTAPTVTQKLDRLINSVGTDEASLNAWRADGFRLTWQDAGNTSNDLYCLAIKGMRTAAGSFNTRTDGNSIPITGLGFTPKGIIFHSLGNNTLGVATAASVCWSMGVASSPSDQRAQAYSEITGSNPAQLATAIEHDAVYISLNASDAVDGVMALTSMDSDGFTCQMTTPDSAATLVKWFAFGDLPASVPGLDANVSLLLHCNPVTDLTTFVDSSANAHPVTPSSGSPVIDEWPGLAGPTPKFKGAFTSTNASLEVADHASLDFGTGDYTIDLWARFTTVANNTAIIHKGTSTSGAAGWSLQLASTGQNFSWHNGSSSLLALSFPPVANTWYHIAVTRASGTVRMFINGALEGSVADAGTKDNAEPLQIGVSRASAANFVGRMTEIRISKGIARWTTDFAPPQAPYA